MEDRFMFVVFLVYIEVKVLKEIMQGDVRRILDWEWNDVFVTPYSQGRNGAE